MITGSGISYLAPRGKAFGSDSIDSDHIDVYDPYSRTLIFENRLGGVPISLQVAPQNQSGSLTFPGVMVVPPWHRAYFPLPSSDADRGSAVYSVGVQTNTANLPGIFQFNTPLTCPWYTTTDDVIPHTEPIIPDSALYPIMSPWTSTSLTDFTWSARDAQSAYGRLAIAQLAICLEGTPANPGADILDIFANYDDVASPSDAEVAVYSPGSMGGYFVMRLPYAASVNIIDRNTGIGSPPINDYAITLFLASLPV